MRSCLALLLLTSWLAGPPARAIQCQTANTALALSEADEPIAAVVRLIRLLALERRVYDPHELETLAAEESLVDPIPFTKGLTSTEALVFRRAYECQLERIADRKKAWEAIRHEIRDRILPELGRVTERREKAGEDTTSVIFPLIRTDLGPGSGPSQGVGPLATTFTWNGRLCAAYPSGGSMVVVDLAEMKMIRQIPIGQDSVTIPPVYFEWQGKSYLLYQAYGASVLDLQTSQKTTGLVSSAVNNLYGHTNLVISTREGEFVVGSPKGVNAEGGLFFYPLRKTSADPPSKLFLKVPGGTSHPPAYAKLGDRAVIGLVDRASKGLVLIDPETQAITHTIPIEGLGMSWGAYYPYFYEIKDGPRVIVAAKGHFVIADPFTGKKIVEKLPMEEPLREPGQLALYSENGARRAAYSGENKIVTLDLETNKTLKIIPSPEEVTSSPAFFEHQGRRYLTWAAEKGKVYIADADSGKILASQKVCQSYVREVIPFEKDGNVMGLVMPRGLDTAPVIVQLAGPPDGKASP